MKDHDSIDDIINEEVRKFYKIRSAEELDTELKRRFGVKYRNLSEKEFNERVRHEIEEEIENRIKNLYKNVSYESLNSRIDNWLNELKSVSEAEDIPTELQGLIWERTRRKRDITRKLSEENERKLRDEQARLRMERMLAEEKAKRIKNYIKMGVAGAALAFSLYLGREYKNKLWREIQSEDSFNVGIGMIRDGCSKPADQDMKSYIKDLFRLNRQLEALVKIGSKRGYSMDEINKLNEELDNDIARCIQSMGYEYACKLRIKRLKNTVVWRDEKQVNLYKSALKAWKKCTWWGNEDKNSPEYEVHKTDYIMMYCRPYSALKDEERSAGNRKFADKFINMAKGYYRLNRINDKKLYDQIDQLRK
jgi:hypothetical protein